MVGIRHLPCRLPISRRALTGLDAVAEPPTSPSPFLGVEGEVRRGLALCLAHSDPPGRCQLLLQLLSVLLSQLPHLLHHPQAASCQRCDLEGRERWKLEAVECGGHCHPRPGLERHLLPSAASLVPSGQSFLHTIAFIAWNLSVLTLFGTARTTVTWAFDSDS